jgi:hypothetical protein
MNQSPRPEGQEREKLDAAIEAALPMLNTEARKALTFVRWKDGIDCDYVTAECNRFVTAVLRNLAIAVPQPSLTSPAPKLTIPPMVMLTEERILYIFSHMGPLIKGGLNRRISDGQAVLFARTIERELQEIAAKNGATVKGDQ